MTFTPDWWTKEDAALFDAAPGLLEACKLIREFVPAAQKACSCERCNAVRQLDAAIAKVEPPQ